MKLKRLNLEEMWKLYLLLKPAIENREPEELLIDEVDKLLSLLPPGTLVASLHILYDNIPSDIHGIEAVTLFVAGIKENEFYSFVGIIKGLSDGSTNSK